MNERTEALQRIAALVREHGLSRDEVLGVIGRPPEATGWARSLLAIVGGLLVLAGLIAALQLVWDDLMPLTRVILVFGIGVVALVLALAALKDARFEKASTPLLLVAALFQCAGLFVLFNVYPTGWELSTEAVLAFGVLAAQFGSLFAALKRTELLFLLVLFVFLALGALFTRLDVDPSIAAVVLGVAGLLVTYGIERTEWRGFCSLTWFVFATTVCIGLFDLVEGRFPLDLVLIVLAAVLIQVSVFVNSRALLVQGVLAMLAFLGYFTREYFADALGWPIALILFGFVLLALSGYAVRLGQGMRRVGP